MSDLKASVQAAIVAYVRSKQETHTPVDVLRMIRDQAELQYERQTICDALDADPMHQLGDVMPQMKRIQGLMEVVSCRRVVTLDGYTRNDAVVEWKRDDQMKDVTFNVQLTFHYERRKVNEADDHGSRVLYTIDIAKDFGPKERLLVIEVHAIGDGPSVTPAEPLDEEDWEDTDGDDAMDAEIDTGDSAKHNDEKEQQQSDRYAAYIDPDVLHDLLQWTNLGMDEYTTFFFLMTFPFYEHEWDLVGFVLDTVFGEAMEEDDKDSGQSDEETLNGGIAGSQQEGDNDDDDSDL